MHLAVFFRGKHVTRGGGDRDGQRYCRWIRVDPFVNGVCVCVIVCLH